jgi:hypothetical protein
LFAVIEQLAGIGRHQFFGGASAVWAGDNRDQSHKRGPRYQGGGKRRSVTLFCHIDSPRTRYFEHGGDDAMHFANYIVLGLLIVCMLSAAAMVLSRAKSH